MKKRLAIAERMLIALSSKKKRTFIYDRTRRRTPNGGNMTRIFFMYRKEYRKREVVDYEALKTNYIFKIF